MVNINDFHDFSFDYLSEGLEDYPYLDHHGFEVTNLLYNASDERLIDLTANARKPIITSIRRFFKTHKYVSQKQRKLLAIYVISPQWFNKWKEGTSNGNNKTPTRSSLGLSGSKASGNEEGVKNLLKQKGSSEVAGGKRQRKQVVLQDLHGVQKAAQGSFRKGLRKNPRDRLFADEFSSGRYRSSDGDIF
jgi:hypothetical protein